MRQLLEGAAVRVSMRALLPSILQQDDVTTRWIDGLDEVLAPVVQTLDSLEAYFDPMLAPEDFLSWLGMWIGVTDAEILPEPRRRELVGSITYLYGMRGTLAGLSHILALVAPAEVVALRDAGHVSWSLDPTDPVPSVDGPQVTVRARGTAVDVERTRQIVQSWVPAHVTVAFEVADDEGDPGGAAP